MKADRSIVLRPTVGIPTRLRYKDHLHLAPGCWDIASGQAGTKNSDQLRDEDLPPFLQEGREDPIHSWAFVWVKGIYGPPHSSTGDDPFRHLPF
jgi:hypothetical protein